MEDSIIELLQNTNISSLPTILVHERPYPLVSYEQASTIMDGVVNVPVPHNMCIGLMPRMYEMNTSVATSSQLIVLSVAKENMQRLMVFNRQTGALVYRQGGVSNVVPYTPHGFLMSRCLRDGTHLYYLDSTTLGIYRFIGNFNRQVNCPTKIHGVRAVIPTNEEHPVTAEQFCHVYVDGTNVVLYRYDIQSETKVHMVLRQASRQPFRLTA